MSSTLQPPDRCEDQLDIFLLIHRSMRQGAAALVATVEQAGATPTLARWIPRPSPSPSSPPHRGGRDLLARLMGRSDKFTLASEVTEADTATGSARSPTVAAALVGDGDAVAAARELDDVLNAHLDHELVAIPRDAVAPHRGRVRRAAEEASKRGGLADCRGCCRGSSTTARRRRSPTVSPPCATPVRWMNTLVWSRRYQRLSAPIRSARRSRANGRRPRAARRDRRGAVHRVRRRRCPSRPRRHRWWPPTAARRLRRHDHRDRHDFTTSAKRIVRSGAPHARQPGARSPTRCSWRVEPGVTADSFIAIVPPPVPAWPSSALADRRQRRGAGRGRRRSSAIWSRGST